MSDEEIFAWLDLQGDDVKLSDVTGHLGLTIDEVVDALFRLIRNQRNND